MLDEVGENQRNRARHAGHTMHEDVGLLARLMDEADGGIEMHAQVIVLMVLAGNVECVGDVLLGVADMHVFAGGQYRLDSMFCVG